MCVLEFLSMCVHLERLNKGPQKDADGVALPQKFNEPSSPEQPQEAQVQQSVLLDRHQLLTKGAQ